MNPDWLRNIRQRRSGLTLVDVMLATMLAAMLLIAVVTALRSMLGSIEVNDSAMRSQQAGRVTLNLITTKIRRAREVYVGLPTIHPASSGTVDAGDLTLVIPEFDPSTNSRVDHVYQFHFDSVNQQLQLSRDDGAPVTILGNTPTLKLSFLNFKATSEIDTSDAAYPFKYRYVTISLTLAVDPGTANPSSLTLGSTAYARSVALDN